MRMKSLQTAAEAAGFAMAPIDDNLFDDDAPFAIPHVGGDDGHHSPVPDAAPRFHVPAVVQPYATRSYADSFMRGLTGFGSLLTRRAPA